MRGTGNIPIRVPSAADTSAVERPVPTAYRALFKDRFLTDRRDLPVLVSSAIDPSEQAYEHSLMTVGQRPQESLGWGTMGHRPRVGRPVALGREPQQSPLCPIGFEHGIGSVRVLDNSVEIRYSTSSLEGEAVRLMEQLADYYRGIVAYVGATLGEAPPLASGGPPSGNDRVALETPVLALDVRTLIAKMDDQARVRHRVEQLYSWGQEDPDEPAVVPESLRRMIEFCRRPFLPTPEIFVSPDGYMVVTWETANYLINLDFLPDGQVEWTKLDRAVEGNPLETGLSSVPDMVTQVLEWL